MLPALLREGAFVPRGVVAGETFLYHGWILTPGEYANLEDAVKELGGDMLVSMVADNESQFGANWLKYAGELTPETVVISSAATDGEILEAASQINGESYFIKGANKSVGVWEKMFAKDMSEVIERVNDLRDYAPEEDFVLIRAFEKWSNNEIRTWWLNGDLVHSHEHSKNFGAPIVDLNDFNDFIPALKSVAHKFSSPLVTIDIVQSLTGEWRIVEVGNGQVSEPKAKPFNEFFNVGGVFE